MKTKPNRSEIVRVGLGFVIGAIVAVAYFAVQAWPYWQLFAGVGAMLAVALVPLIGLPLYGLLRRYGGLNIYAAILGGGCLTLLPYVIFELVVQPDGASFSQVGDTVYVRDGALTTAGFLSAFLWTPLWFFAGGAIGGAVAWVATFGCVYAYRGRNERQLD